MSNNSTPWIGNSANLQLLWWKYFICPKITSNTADSESEKMIFLSEYQTRHSIKHGLYIYLSVFVLGVLNPRLKITYLGKLNMNVMQYPLAMPGIEKPQSHKNNFLVSDGGWVWKLRGLKCSNCFWWFIYTPLKSHIFWADLRKAIQCMVVIWNL